MREESGHGKQSPKGLLSGRRRLRPRAGGRDPVGSPNSQENQGPADQVVPVKGFAPEKDPGGHRNDGREVGEDGAPGGAKFGNVIIHPKEGDHRREDTQIQDGGPNLLDL